MHVSLLIQLMINTIQLSKLWTLCLVSCVLVRKLFSPSLYTSSFLFYLPSTFSPLHHLILSSLCLGLMWRDPPLSFSLKTKLGYNSCYRHQCFGDLKTTYQQHISLHV